MGLRETELTVGRRVMTSLDRVPDCYPWSERYGSIVEIERFMDRPPLISVRLDGEASHVIPCRLEDLDIE